MHALKLASSPPVKCSIRLRPGLAQVYRLERQFDWPPNARPMRTPCEVEYGIPSLSQKQACPLQVLKIRRCHWEIETSLHYQRDVTFQEDATHMTCGHLGKLMPSINNLVLALIRQTRFHNAAQARRWFAGNLPQTFAILTTPFSQLSECHISRGDAVDFGRD